MKNHKNALLLSLLLLSFSSVLVGQNSQIVVSEKGKFKKTKVYTKCDIQLTTGQLLTLFSEEEDLKVYYKPMALNYAAGAILNSAASILILWPVTESAYKDDPNWYLAYIGAGCAVLAIPFNRAFERHTAKAVEYYNSRGIKDESLEFKIGGGQYGMGLVVKF